MSKSNKRRKVGSSELESKKHPPQSCVVGIEHGNFTPFSNIRGDPTEKLAQLHNIRDQRLTEPLGFIHRMDLVCGLIPETLEDVDLDSPWISSALLPAFSRKLKSTEGLRNISIKCLDQSKTSFSPQTISCYGCCRIVCITSILT